MTASRTQHRWFEMALWAGVSAVLSVQASAGPMVSQQRRDAKSALASGNKERAAELFRLACDGGDGYSCRDYARLMEAQGLLRRAARFYGLACIAKIPTNCAKSGELWEHRRSTREAIRAYEWGCEQKDESACESLHRLKPETAPTESTPQESAPAAVPTPEPTPIPTPTPLPTPPPVEIEPPVEVINRPIPGPTPEVKPPQAQGFDYWQEMMKKNQ